MIEEQMFFYEIGQNLELSIKSQMFGKECFKINGKAFICFFQNEIVCKLNVDEKNEALEFEKTKLFDPSGKNRSMKEWVQIPYLHKHLWAKYAEAAYNYVKNK